MIASFEYIGSAVIAVLPMESLKLMTTVLPGIKLIPLSRTALSDMYSFVSLMYLPHFDRSPIEIHL